MRKIDPATSRPFPRTRFGLRVADAVPSADGRRVFVRIVDKDGQTVSNPDQQDRRSAEAQRAYAAPPMLTGGTFRESRDDWFNFLVPTS